MNKQLNMESIRAATERLKRRKTLEKEYYELLKKGSISKAAETKKEIEQIYNEFIKGLK